MKRRLFIGIAVVSLFLCLSAAYSAVAAPAARAHDAAVKPTGKCMMWTVRSQSATVYVVGSMHEGRPEMYPLPKEMEEAFAKTDVLVEEIKDEKTDDAFGDEVFEKNQYAGDEALASHLAPDQWKDVTAACEAVGLPLNVAAKSKPEFLRLALRYYADKKLAKRGTGGPPPGIDEHFTDEARKRNLSVEGFETLKFQVDLILSTPEKLAVHDLLEEVSRINEPLVREDPKFAIWLSGDADAMDQSNAKWANDNPGYARHLLYDRSSRMANQIEQYLKGDKTVFVVVGCLHVVGDRGIAKMLRDDGFVVEQSPATKPRAAVTR